MGSESFVAKIKSQLSSKAPGREIEPTTGDTFMIRQAQGYYWRHFQCKIDALRPNMRANSLLCVYNSVGYLGPTLWDQIFARLSLDLPWLACTSWAAQPATTSWRNSSSVIRRPASVSCSLTFASGSQYFHLSPIVRAKGLIMTRMHYWWLLSVMQSFCVLGQPGA